jgi:hypothetical protein
MAITAAALDAARPDGGLFAAKDWLSSPEPFPLDPRLSEELSRLGHRLHRFLAACDGLHRRSRDGRMPPWIASLTDCGKPPELSADNIRPAFAQQLPDVIRPDLLLTEDGFRLTEIDSVPGGIGLTAWLNETYARLNPAWQIAGGTDGMTRGFQSIFPRGADIAVSAESSDYRPEMNWLAQRLGSGFETVDAESARPRGRDLYRFFELFDLASIRHWQEWQHAAATGQLRISAPPKPWLEEKLWLALFWSRPLREFWRSELRENHRDALARIIPFGWVVDPAPMPPHAVLPKLDAASWDEVAAFSQKQRRLVLKLSGFSPLAWGSRSVVIGHDVSQHEWSGALESAQHDFQRQPWVVQDFAQGRLVDHPYFEPGTGTVRTMRGRVRLCPYYFTARDSREPVLGGVLATIVPADKKIIHGMKDGILVPCRIN